MEEKTRAGFPRLLLIGDELYTIFLLLNYLESCGYQVASARNCDSAFSLLQTSPPDLILLCDDGMPSVDSTLFLKQVRQTIPISRTPVILLSSRNQTPEQARCLDHEIDAYIVKPFELEDLQAQISSMLRQAVIAA